LDRLFNAHAHVNIIDSVLNGKQHRLLSLHRRQCLKSTTLKLHTERSQSG